MFTIRQLKMNDMSVMGISNVANYKLEIEKLNVYYGDFHALIDVGMKISDKSITAIIGPSGCGKSTLLRSLNRINELINGAQISGKILLDGKDIYEIDIFSLRKRVGMVFQRPNPFPLSVFDNIAYGPRVHGESRKGFLSELVERSLSAVKLWEELKDRLKENALTLTDEQKQRLCIARLLAVEPEVLLMDEPCSTLDPIATLHIEELMRGLAQNYSIVIVTHNMQQAARVSNYAGFMLLGELVEFGKTSDIFTSPKDKRTEDFLLGRFG
jgi:phosphate transport system ATP-binding protein